MAIQVFGADDSLPDLPQGLADDDALDFEAKFGVKIVTENGVSRWEPATEDDYRNSEAERLGISAADVSIQVSCVQTGPRSCSGSCWQGFCTLMYNPSQQFYYCGCS